MKDKISVKWIGLVKLIVLNESDILNGAKSAYTNVVGFAKTKTEFRNGVKWKLQSMELKLIRLEGAEPLIERLSRSKVSKEILKLANHLSNTNSVAFSTFHSYPEF